MMKVGVIMGGISSEIEVSLNTGREMMNHLDRNKYEVIPVVFSKPEERSKNKEVSLHVE